MSRAERLDAILAEMRRCVLAGNELAATLAWVRARALIQEVHQNGKEAA